MQGSSVRFIACPLSVQVCLAAVGLVCDLCRALMANILPYCDEIMQLLLENLGVSNSHFLKHLCKRVCLYVQQNIPTSNISTMLAVLCYYLV